MHAERDVLVRAVFPELRRRAAPHGLHLQEVELRWGVTEEETARTLEHCLGEVCRSQLLLGLLGERYGMVPPHPHLPDIPQFDWVRAEFIKGMKVWCVCCIFECCVFKCILDMKVCGYGDVCVHVSMFMWISFIYVSMCVCMRVSVFYLGLYM